MHSSFAPGRGIISPHTTLPFLLPVFFLLLATPVFPCDAPQLGSASWYGGRFVGRETASGEVFDTEAFTAAHRSLPFGSVVAVKNLENDRSVEVRINDRGPFIQGRVIDLSRAAARALDMIESGTAEVELCVVSGAALETVELQVGSFTSRTNAEAVRRRLADEGINATIRHDESLFRVVVEKVTENRVEKTKAELEELGFPGAFPRR